jgi:hypothetical protein
MLNLRAETLKDIESIDIDKNGFERDEMKQGIPADLGTTYKASNVHVFFPTTMKATEWASLLQNVPLATDVEKLMKSLKESKSPLVFPPHGGSEASRVTVFNLQSPGAPAELTGEEQRVLVATAATENEAKLVSFPVSALLSLSAATTSSNSDDVEKVDSAPVVVAPWNNSAICKDHSADRFVMICSHIKRDPRCGACGAILVDLLQQEIDKQLSAAATASAVEADTLDVMTVPSRIVGAFQGKIHVARCSHVGGHVHAGNVAVVTKDGGVMFGCVTPADVPLLAKSLISSQPVVQSLMSIETLKNKVRGALLAGIRGPKF